MIICLFLDCPNDVVDCVRAERILHANGFKIYNATDDIEVKATTLEDVEIMLKEK